MKTGWYLVLVLSNYPWFLVAAVLEWLEWWAFRNNLGTQTPRTASALSSKGSKRPYTHSKTAIPSLSFWANRHHSAGFVALYTLIDQ